MAGASDLFVGTLHNLISIIMQTYLALNIQTA